MKKRSSAPVTAPPAPEKPQADSAPRAPKATPAAVPKFRAGRVTTDEGRLFLSIVADNSPGGIKLEIPFAVVASLLGAIPWQLIAAADAMESFEEVAEALEAMANDTPPKA